MRGVAAVIPYASATGIRKDSRFSVERALGAIPESPGPLQVEMLASPRSVSHNAAVRDAAPMKVTAEGTDQTLHPGDCKEVSGKKIVATAAQPLTGSAHIVATFHHEKSKMKA